MDLNALEDFQLVAAHGGFGRASRASGRSKATLSRRVADLEDSLGIRLIERGERSLGLTEAGQILLARLEGPMREVADAIAAARDGLEAPRGRLRVAAPLLFSQVALGRLAAAFQALYPQVQIEAVSEDRVADLVEEHFDVAIRINPRKDSVLVGRCFAKDRLLLAAAPAIEMPKRRKGDTPRVPAVVTPSYRDGELWSVQGGQLVVEPQPVLRLSSLLTVRDAVTAGAGAAMLPQSLIGHLLDKGELVAWGAAGDEVELWVLHTSRRLQSPKVRAFVEFICGCYPSGVFFVDA
ncbi:LysR family transcriptional regulator [Xanthomonas translucens pv. arrhenatheri]|uniref:Transcriptional regulator n=1 Tax=Xanthomonas graminis pv. arrhenatheri LMG 727 TaxID=1195923 RepID=A0A0K2ZQE9_9XANT|nr:LysR family transcriptional regulator [Xanthomonas translucens]OAX67511.1 LysR family transcriptional regulator [Xanthomonas translucens pv. arrhenatheri]UKE77883.1 LysR family transcriptional regulator [Xanthomonas translucens pv. arrhenatheri]CTP86464.1 transcriptional regulator [Xanthomonas translucens pv. arrhenatheri LMG 727]